VAAPQTHPEPREPSSRPRIAGRADAGASGDCRCVCGSLVARLVAGAIELKCRRCKRTLVVRLADLESGEASQLDFEVVASDPIDRAGGAR
jgi:hypothetical protein